MIEDAFDKEKGGIYRKNVGAVILNSKKQIFVGKRFGTSFAGNFLQMPQGGIKDDETEEEALMREIKEEVGILPNIFNIVKKTEGYYYYEIPQKMRKSVWNNIYIGQKQRWFLLSFNGKDEDINVNTDFPEFEGWKWLEPKEVIEHVISFKKDIYKKIFLEFNLLN